jgi:predicted secreted protein
VALADTAPPTYDRVELAVTARQDVDNDTLTAVLYAQRQGVATPPLAAEVNQAMAMAMERAKAVPEVRAQTLGYQTNPVYNKQTLTGWRVTQSLHLESNDPAKLSALIGELQPILAVQSIDYSISPERRQAAEDSLIRTALDLFKGRARLVTERLGRSDYRLVSLNVDTANLPLPRMSMRALAMTAEAATPPTLEAGTQEITVNVHGTIELLIK